jgi:UDP-glucose 4-epimerase
MGTGQKASVALTGSANSLTGLLVHRLVGDPRFRSVVLIDQDPPAGQDSGVRHYPVDISRPGSDEQIAEILETEDVSMMVHLALSTTLGRTPNLTHEVESQGTMHVLSACSMHRVEKLVMMSTTMLYGAAHDNSPWLTEGHKLRADKGFAFFADKIEAEQLVVSFADRNPETLTTILRVCPVLGPNTVNLYTKYLSTSIVPVMAGFDPPVQFIHEVDVVRAFLMVLAEDHPGIYNIVGEGVVPLSTAIRIIGQAPLGVPEPLMGPIMDGLWMFRLAGLPSELVSYLKYPFLASGDLASEAFGFTTSYPPAEVLGDFARALTRKRLQRRADEEEMG